MTRRQFSRIEVRLDQLLLDRRNARIRVGRDQADCITRIMKKETQLLTLVENLARNGLSTSTILVCPGEVPGTWIVRDGNRRVTAMKLLHQPNLAPTVELRLKVEAIKRQHPELELEPVEVHSTDDELALQQEIAVRHNGALDGAGLVTWSSYLRTLSLLQAGQTAENRTSALYVQWAEQQGIYVDDDFPLTTLQRFFKRENLAMLGVTVDSTGLRLQLHRDQVLALAKRVISDFQPGPSALTVDDVFDDARAKAYLHGLRQANGLDAAPSPTPGDASPSSGNATGASAAVTTTEGQASEVSHGQNGTEGPGSSAVGSGPRARPSPLTDGLDRKKLFGRGSPDLPIPDSEVKVRNIVVSLRKIDVSEHTLAAAMLLRHLLESSEDAYRERQPSLEKLPLAKAVKRSAERMNSQGQLSKEDFESVARMCDGRVELVGVEALQQLMHRRTEVPIQRNVNALWDKLKPFIRACWTA